MIKPQEMNMSLRFLKNSSQSQIFKLKNVHFGQKDEILLSNSDSDPGDVEVENMTRAEEEHLLKMYGANSSRYN